MTQVEMYEHIMEEMSADLEVVEFCKEKIAQLNRRKNNSQKLKPEDEELRAAIATLLSENECSMTAKEVAEAIGITSAKASGALNAMYKAEVVCRIETSKSKPYTYIV